MATQTYNVLHKNRIVTQVQNALSHSFVDIDVFDLSNYTVDLSASVIGRAWLEDRTSAVFPENLDSRITGDVPSPESKKRTMLVIWSGAAASGDVLFKGWWDRIESFSIGDYSTL